MTVETVVAVSWWAIVPLIAVGSILHFVYDWTGHHRVAAVFGAVNESYWEHTKIAIWPVAALQVVLFALGGWSIPSFVPAAAVSLYSIPIAMIGIVFVYKVFTKRNLLWLDIVVFALVVALAQVIFVLTLEQLAATAATVVIAALFLAGLIASVLVFTLNPPAEPDVFIDPLTSRYGLHGHLPDPTTPDEGRTP